MPLKYCMQFSPHFGGNLPSFECIKEIVPGLLKKLWLPDQEESEYRKFSPLLIIPEGCPGDEAQFGGGRRIAVRRSIWERYLTPWVITFLSLALIRPRPEADCGR